MFDLKYSKTTKTVCFIQFYLYIKILQARKFNRNELLYKVRRNGNKEPKFTFIITYHPAFSKLKEILRNIHILLIPNEEHRQVSMDVPIVGFKKGKSLNDFLVRARLPRFETTQGGSNSCSGKRCGVCDHVNVSNSFQGSTENTYKIKTCLDCNSSMVVYLVDCKSCRKQYIGSTSTKFRLRFNNYKNCHRKYNLNKSVAQESFHTHFNQHDHNGMNDWLFTLIDSAESVENLRRKEAYWQNKLNSFAPHGLNEREVTLDFG